MCLHSLAAVLRCLLRALLSGEPAGMSTSTVQEVCGRDVVGLVYGGFDHARTVL